MNDKLQGPGISETLEARDIGVDRKLTAIV